MSDFRKQNWLRKFANAFRGIGVVVMTQRSFHVHLFAAALVGWLAWWLDVSRAEGMLLVLCVTLVMTAEILNTSIEFLARQVTAESSPRIRDALDAAAGGVLVASGGAAIVGITILLPRLLEKVLVSG